MADYVENILEAIELLTEKKIQSAGFDKTIKATILSVGDNGEYVCTTGSINFTAHSSNGSYQVNDIVMVNIPENNWDNPKTILNRIYIDNSQQNYIDPFSNFVDLHGGPVVIAPGETGVAANILERSSRSIYSTSNFDELYDDDYTAIGIGLSYKTLLADAYRVCDGTYGIKVTFNDENNTNLASYDISCDTLFGNIYNFNDWMPQKFLIKLPSPMTMHRVKIMNIELYQKNDFYCYNTDTNQKERLEYPVQDPDDNIFASNLALYLGFDKEQIALDTYVLSTNSIPQYYKKWSEEVNTKRFEVYVWEIDEEGNYQKTNEFTPTSFVKRYNAVGDWINVGYNLYDPLTLPEDLDADTIEYQYGNSNIITFYRYKPIPSTIEQDEKNAIKFEYNYKGNDTLQYNKLENQLLSQDESQLPHFIKILWRPTTKELQEPTWLAGAKVTYKVPAYNSVSLAEYNMLNHEMNVARKTFDDAIRAYDRRVSPGASELNKLRAAYADYSAVLANYNSNKYKNHSTGTDASERFLFEKNTVFIHPEPGWEFGDCNDTVRYEEINGISYICWDLTLSEAFIYDENNFDNISGWFADDQTSCNAMKALNLAFRPKEYLLSTMVNNTIYCSITKDDYEFTGSFEVPIRKDFSNTFNKGYILTEDMKKPSIDYYLDSLQGYKVFDKIIHFATFRCNYNKREKYNYDINYLRPIANFDGIDFRQGYWYKDENGDLQSSENTNANVKWYSLIINGGLFSPFSDTSIFMKFIMLQTKIDNMTNIINIPTLQKEYLFINHGLNPSEYRRLDRKITGIDRIFYDASGPITSDKFGPQEDRYNMIATFAPDPFPNEYYENRRTNTQDISDYFDFQTDYHPGYDYFWGVYKEEKITPVAGYYPNESSIIISMFEKFFYPSLITKAIGTAEEGTYLRYSEFGFTPNFKEVGSGDNYPTMFVTTTDSYVHLAFPIVFQQKQMFRDDFEEWDGHTVKIGDDAIYSPVIGAGTKASGAFYGVLMGDVSREDTSLHRSYRYYGLYGYFANQQAFGLRADGTMFIGKHGDGQLLFDGNKASIQSSLYLNTQNSGMLVDFQKGIIDIRNADGAISQQKKNAMIYEQTLKVEKAERDIKGTPDPGEELKQGRLPRLYQISNLFDYVRVGAQEQYDSNTTYYIFSDWEDQYPGTETKTYYKYLKIDELISGEEYYQKDRNSSGDPERYVPSQNELAYEPADGTTPDQDIIYYLYDNNSGKYVAQPFPLTPGQAPNFPTGYYYRANYYYKLIEFDDIFNPDNETNYYSIRPWTYVESQWEEKKSLLYKEIPAVDPDDPSDTPDWGQAIRVYNGLVDTLPSGNDERKYYFYAMLNYNVVVDTSGTPDSNTTYYILVDGEYEAQPVPLEAFEPGITYYIRSYDVKMYQNGAWVDRFTGISSIEQFEQYNYIVEDKELTLNTLYNRNNNSTVLGNWESNYTQRIQDTDTLETTLDALQNEIDGVKTITDEYELAYGMLERGEISQTDFYEIELRYTTMNDNIITECTAVTNANNVITGQHRLDFRDAFMDYKSQVDPFYSTLYECLNDAGTGYNKLFSDYKEAVETLEEYQQIVPGEGIVYGIRLDASDENVYTGGKIDLSKLPLKIGKLSKPPFTVNWQGEMTATAGLIGGWNIGTNRLSSENTAGKLVLSSVATENPLTIGNKFSVSWDGKVRADDVIINSGTLSGVINSAEGTVIKNISIVNGNSKGLKWEGNDLKLDGGLILGTGGSITLDNGYIKFNQNSGLALSGWFNYQNYNVNWNTVTIKDVHDQRKILHFLGYITT